jgi:hypothetical protein
MSRALGRAEGKQEVASTVKVTRTGDGLSNALEADPRGWAVGDRVPVLMWTNVEDVNHKQAKEGKGVVRRHNFVCEEMVVLDFLPEEQIDGMFAAQREAVKAYELEQTRLEEEAAGVQRVPFGDGESESNGEGPSGVSDASVMTDDEWQASAARESVPSIGRRKRGEVGGDA